MDSTIGNLVNQEGGNVRERRAIAPLTADRYRGVEIQCQWHQLSSAKSVFGTTGLVIGNLLSTSLKIALDTTQDLLAQPVAP